MIQWFKNQPTGIQISLGVAAFVVIVAILGAII